MKYLVSIVSILLTACTSQPKPPPAHLLPYLGEWYEIIRQDHAFEEGLTNVTASYVFDQGVIHVKNRGYSSFDKEWREVKGRAELANSNGHDYLKVTFFRPFYGSYVVFELDEESDQYALVIGLNGEHFWLLSKTPTMPKAVKNRLLARVQALGFHMDKVVEVTHSAL